MKHIIKSAEPQTFSDWKKANPGATYKKHLCDKSDVTAVAAKRALKQSLIDEQHYICCYCEERIGINSSHIEHFKPKGDAAYAHLQLDYGNLHASCLLNPTGDADEHCGHRKKNDYSADLISPLEPDCASHFSYTLNGHISHMDNRGDYTIKILHLDSGLLNAKRKMLIDQFIACDEKDVEAEIADHLDETKTMYGEFFTMIQYLSNNKML